MKPSTGPGLYLTRFLGIKVWLNFDGDVWTAASGEKIEPGGIFAIESGPFVRPAAPPVIPDLRPEIASLKKRADDAADGLVALKLRVDAMGLSWVEAALHDGCAEAMKLPTIAQRLTALETHMRHALGNDDAFHNRIADLEKNCHEPQDIETRVIQALIKLGVIVQSSDGNPANVAWQVNTSNMVLEHQELIDAQAGAVDRQESDPEEAPTLEPKRHMRGWGDLLRPENFGDRVKASLSVDVPDEELAAADIRYNAEGYKRLRDHLSNVRPLPAMEIPDWLAAVIAADGRRPVSVTVHPITDQEKRERKSPRMTVEYADEFPPRPEFRQHKAKGEWGKYPANPAFRFQVGERVQWTNREHRRYFGFWTVKGQHVGWDGGRMYELDGTKERVPEGHLDPAWTTKVDTAPRPGHWKPTHVSIQEKGDSEHTRINDAISEKNRPVPFLFVQRFAELQARGTVEWETALDFARWYHAYHTTGAGKPQ